MRYTSLLACTVGLGLAAMTGIPSALAHSDRDDDFGRHRHGMPRVFAEGAAPSYHAARMQAVHRWRDKVADRFGYQYSRWWTARSKDVNCRLIADDDPSWDTFGRNRMTKERHRHHYEPVTRCTVSAIPARTNEHFGWFKN
jgi:hypothetical protein